FQTSIGYGHGALMSKERPGIAINVPDLEDYEKSILPEMAGRLGIEATEITPIVSTVFPNFSPFYGRATIRVWHPRGPDKTEIWAWCLVDKAALDDVKDRVRKHYIWTFGPGGSAEEDDMENWQYCTVSSAGPAIKRYPLNYQLALRSQWHDEVYSGSLSIMTSEHDARGFYDCWSELMSGKSWLEVAEALSKKEMSLGKKS
ncbi:MAG TPA: SRPBCC family protein, partial [Dehalococcoidia bacterium]|nr:SRPBCC family protein [Dehalococcoidia bacterium]